MSAEALYLLRLRSWLDAQDERPYTYGHVVDRITEGMRSRLRVTAAHLIGFMA